jgi:tetratricopeptide (TPR) repeat protein
MEFNPQILAEIDHLDPANLQVILNELENHQLIEKKVELSGGTRYRFIHSAIREVLLQEINPLRRQTIEFTTANRLEAHLPMGDGSQAAILAQHYEQGGKSVQAFEKWLQAGQYARQLFSTKEAELSFKRADELIDLLATLPVNSIYELFSEWTEIYLESENAEAIEQLSRRLEQIGRKRDNVFLVGTALNILCQAYLIRDQFETGQEVAKFALQMLEREPSSVALIDALCHFGVFSYMQGNFKQALQSFERAVQSAGSVTTKTERRVRANAYYQLSFVQAMMAIPSPAEKNAFLSLEDYLVINRPYGQCYAYSALVLSNYALGELTKALQFCNQGIELAQRIQATRILGYLHAYHSMIDFDRAELDSALEHAEQVISIGDLLHHSDITSLGFRMKADLFSFIAAEEAIHYYQIALPSSKTSFLYVDLLNRLGLINSLFRDKTKGLEQVETAMSLGKTTGLFSFSYQARISRLIIQLLDGDPQETIQLAYPIIEESRQRKLKSIELSGLWILGRAWLKSGDYPAAITCLTDLVDEASRIPYTWLVVQGLVDLHQALIQNGQADEIYPVILKAILDRTTQKIQKPGIREAFETYKTAILQAGK